LTQVMEVKRVLAFDVLERVPATSSAVRVEKKKKALKKTEKEQKEEKEEKEGKEENEDLPDVDWATICRSTVPKKNSLVESVKFIVTSGIPVAAGKGLISYKQQKMTITSNDQTFIILFDALCTLETKVGPSSPQPLCSWTPRWPASSVGQDGHIRPSGASASPTKEEGQLEGRY
jgi:hypothetical protein